MSWSTGEVGGASEGHDGGADTRRGMPKIRGWIFDTPRNYQLLLVARLPQQFAITSAHQSKTALHEMNGPIAQIVSFPGVLGNTFGAEQNFSDHAVTIAAHSRIECAESQRQSLTPLGR